jgi:hypothetical protein
VWVVIAAFVIVIAAYAWSQHRESGLRKTLTGVVNNSLQNQGSRAEQVTIVSRRPVGGGIEYTIAGTYSGEVSGTVAGTITATRTGEGTQYELNLKCTPGSVRADDSERISRPVKETPSGRATAAAEVKEELTRRIDWTLRDQGCRAEDVIIVSKRNVGAGVEYGVRSRFSGRNSGTVTGTITVTPTGDHGAEYRNDLRFEYDK